MKKILAIALMLCLFTAFAVGTASAGVSYTRVSAYQNQCAEAYGVGATAAAAQAAGTLSIKDCRTKITAAGGAQIAYASAYYGAASVRNTQSISVVTC